MDRYLDRPPEDRNVENEPHSSRNVGVIIYVVSTVWSDVDGMRTVTRTIDESANYEARSLAPFVLVVTLTC